MIIVRSIDLKKILALLTLLSVMGFVTDASAYRSITNRKNGVTVNVKPLQVSAGKEAKFQIRLNTHSVDISQDIVAVSILRDNQGREYQPLKWKGSPPGGHHRSGILVFPTPEGHPKTLTLIIKNVANVPERVFQWKVEP